jgi:hypothetical protein
MARWMIGLADSAVSSIRSARSLAERLQHPLTTVAAAWFEVWLRYQRGENEAALEAAERLMALAEPQGFKPWTDVAIVMRHAVDPRAVTDDSLDERGVRWNRAGRPPRERYSRYACSPSCMGRRAGLRTADPYSHPSARGRGKAITGPR